MAAGKMTFVKFLNEYIIEIPRIQRDYVQGRAVTTEQKEKRSDFVGNLIGALSDGGRPCVLDFVYGYPTGDGAVRTFIPLDGQQRLTSLYLLHWYFLHLVAEKQPDEESIFDADGTKMQKLNGKFKYNNRISSTEFCQRLTSRSAFIKIDGETEIRKIIMQQPWFDEEWINDPTIESMLDMLTEFETTLKNKEYRELADMAEKLFSEDHECIYFDTLSLKDLKQGESLYVKMNARGKKLTRFENWKAKFTKMLDDVHKDEEFNYGDISRCNSLKYKDYFCYSIEHDWNDLFWHFVTKDIKWDNVEDVMNNPYPTVDRAFSNFLCFVHQILYFYDRNDAKAKTSDFQWTFAQNEETYGNGKVSNLEFLFQCLDFLSHIDNSYTNGRGKGMGAFFDDVFYNKNNNCDTPSVGHKVRIAGDISNLYEKAIGYYTDDKKKKVVNNLEDSSKFNLTEMYLLWAILKYCAPKYCSNRQSNYAVDDQLRYYVRDCRNRLDAFDQFLTDKVTMSPNLRLVDANIIIGKMPTQLFSKARYADTPLQDLYEWLDDFDYLYEGNVNSNHAYLPILNKIESKQTQITVQQVRDFVTAFEKRTTLDKIRLLISVGYKGKTGIGTTGGNRERYLFGQKNRWSVFFVEDAAVLSPLLEQLIKDYSGCQDIQTQIDNYKQSTAVNTFAYYMLNYDFALWGTNESSNLQHDDDGFAFFAVLGQLDDMDIISLRSISGQPLSAYHIDPLVCAVVKQCLSSCLSLMAHIKVIGRFGTKHGIAIANSVQNDVYDFEMVSNKDGWNIKTDNNGLLNYIISSNSNIKYNNDIFELYVNNTKETDKVKIGKAILEEIIKIKKW